MTGYREERRSHWERMYSEQRRSGASMTDFCHTRGLNRSTFQQAIVRYGLSHIESHSSADSARSKQAKTSFIELTDTSPTQASEHRALIEASYSGFTLRVFSEHHIPVLVHALYQLKEPNQGSPR